jgi:mRNA-degrading endonuclease YafQ of YafQ-DinJ toxin-antitoxin module
MTENSPWQLVRTETFLRALRKYLRKHRERETAVRRVLETLSQDPYSPSLRLHALTGEKSGLHAVRVTYGDRVILILAIENREIVLLDIGAHDEVYR